jgi:hypothetical protein
MKRLVLACLAIATVLPLAPAHADDWVVIGHSTAHQPGLVNLEALLATAGGATKCPATDYSTIVYDLAETTWLDPLTGRVDYEWNGGGEVRAKATCAASATASARICDYAGGGYPAVICSQPATVTSTLLENGWYVAKVTVALRVRYYDPPALYQRGNSVVRNQVNGSYAARGTAGQTAVPCWETITSVIPTPARPYMTSSDQALCSS